MSLREKNIVGADPHGAEPPTADRRHRRARGRWTRRSARLADEQPGLVAQYNRTGGAGGYTFELKPNVAETAADPGGRAGAADGRAPRQRARRRRADRRAATASAGDQILVQLPGVNDPEQVKRLIGTTALLELKIVEGGPAASQEALLQATGGVVPPDMEVVTGADRDQPRRRSPITWCARWRR